MLIDFTERTMRREVWTQLPLERILAVMRTAYADDFCDVDGFRGADVNFEQLTREVMDWLGFACVFLTPRPFTPGAEYGGFCGRRYCVFLDQLEAPT